jgi:hypothetical protein
MNVTEYISSGILELYASGNASPQEKQEVECMSHIYPEIKEELQHVQHALEEYAKLHAVTPPAHLKAKILAQLHTASAQDSHADIKDDVSISLPSIESKTELPALAESRPNNMEMTYAKKPSRVWMYATAASLMLCAAIGYWSANVAEDLQGKVAGLEKNIQTQTEQSAQYQQDIEIYKNPQYRKIQLAGIKEKSPASLVTVFWNKDNQEVRLVANNLPAPTQGKQYQLWAIKDGKPVDMGMLPNDITTNSLVKMNNIDSAQAFAITLENKGGVPSPTMTEMYVMGGVL